MIIVIIIIIYILYADHVRKKPMQEKPSAIASIISGAEHLNRRRLFALAAFIVGSYSITFTWLNFAWYRLYARNKFHWFDDRREWNQMDKTGHVFSAYFETVWAYELLRWAGVDNKRAAITAAFLGMGFHSSIEIWDGYSAKWGASWSDLCANFIGASLAMTQYLLWEDQRIMCKYSYNGSECPYPKGELSDRADNLFGKTFIERVLKDYNNMTLWVSVNPSKFIPSIKPDWLCLAVGYKSENLYGGFENKWIDEKGKAHDRTDLPRYRVIKFSLDADLPRLRKNDPTGKAVFGALNLFKMPFPSYKIRMKE